MKRVGRAVGVLVVTVVATFSVNSQQVTKTQSTDPVVNNQTTTKTYVFPSAGERFKRYLLSTVGPWRLMRTGLSAGIDQWRDQPEEWGQGAKGLRQAIRLEPGPECDPAVSDLRS